MQTEKLKKVLIKNSIEGLTGGSVTKIPWS